MQQFDMNGPQGKGLVQIDPATGKKLKVQQTLAESLRSSAGATVTGKKITDRQRALEQAGQ